MATVKHVFPVVAVWRRLGRVLFAVNGTRWRRKMPVAKAFSCWCLILPAFKSRSLVKLDLQYPWIDDRLPSRVCLLQSDISHLHKPHLDHSHISSELCTKSVRSKVPSAAHRKTVYFRTCQNSSGTYINVGVRAVCNEDKSTVAEKYKPSMLADFPSMVIFLFCAGNFAATQDKLYRWEEKFG